MYTTVLFFIVFISKLLFDIYSHKVANPYTKSIVWYLLFYLVPLGYFLETGVLTHSIEWITAYNIELALSIDNLAVILMLMKANNVLGVDQKTVLNYGIFGAVIMRIVLLTFGLGLLTKAAFIIFPVFGLLLIKAAWKMYQETQSSDEHEDSKETTMADSVRGFLGNIKVPTWLPFSSCITKVLAWSLLPVILAVEATDLIFAIDSVPAVLAISSSWVVVATSNLAAVAFLRELFFVFSDLQSKLTYLNYGVATALGVIGLKLLAHPFIHIHETVNAIPNGSEILHTLSVRLPQVYDILQLFNWSHIHITPVTSLIAVMVPIILSIIVSVISPKKEGSVHA